MPLDEMEMVRLDGIRRMVVKLTRDGSGGGPEWLDDMAFLLTIISEMELEQYE